LAAAAQESTSEHTFMARIINGIAIAEALRGQVRDRVAELGCRGVVPGLAAILVGDDPASGVYVRRKVEACQQVGIDSRAIHLPAAVSAEDLFGVIDRLNADAGIHGILVQLPLPEHLPYKAVLARVCPSKDVDGFHPLNNGLVFVGDRSGFVPATPAGIMELLRHEKIVTQGRHVVIVGCSLIVGKPLASLLVAPGTNATVTMTHQHTVDLGAHTRLADILVVAVGKPGLICADMVKPGAVVIDVGINRVPDLDSPRRTRLVGDVDFAGVSAVAAAITPVPGGVGPVTIATLLRNTVEAAERGLERRDRDKGTWNGATVSTAVAPAVAMP
jgi:methylenetetrahydrofolate dehydrogenase (NADP+) / methenyltetrahydrofolate cyclohydrolase